MKKIRVLIDIWIARLGSAFGWVWLVFWGMMAAASLAMLPEAKELLDWMMPAICLGLAVTHYFLIRAMKRTKRLIQDFRLYSSVIAGGEETAAGIAETLKTPEEEVMRELREMCRRGYFNGHIDFQTRRMKLDPAGEQYVARCPGCGATTAIYKTGDACRYCGAPLVRKD